MLLCPINRIQLLQFLPSGGEVAEIGVAEGDFSAAILANAPPRRLHLIDPWEHQDREDYRPDVSNVAATEQEARYTAVRARFAAEIASGGVNLMRDYSEDAVAFFADGQLDWVYVDGMHTAEAAYRDLTLYYPKLRSGGFLAGHDYTNHAQAQAWNFGVVEAVNRFVLERGLRFIALTYEAFPTYVLAADGPMAQALHDTLVRHVPYVIELRDFPRAGRFEHRHVTAGSKLLAYPSF